ncbi:MAG: hypothetical protein IJK04_10200, partial [Kiritimatiellae bacterium]|nr:hypothetical protein [Kiritimatiellia bacterium]
MNLKKRSTLFVTALLALTCAGGARGATLGDLNLELPAMGATWLDPKDEEFPNSNLNELTQPLDYAIHFALPLPAEQQIALDGNYFVDFVLTLNKDVLLVDPAAIMPQIQNGTLTVEQAAAMPAGCIVGAVNPSNPWWMAVPTMGQMQLSANTPYRVCSDIAAQGTLNWTLPIGPSSLWGENESGFLCGIWFTPGFHAANPDLVITLEPRLYKYNVEDQSNPIDMGPLGNALHFPSPHVTIIPPTQAEPNAIVAAIDNGYLTPAATEPAIIDYSSLLPNLSVEFNIAAVQQIATTAGDSSIKLKIKDVTESGVTDSKTIQITLVDENDNPVYAEGTAAGTATVIVPFPVESGKVPVVYYVNGSTKTKVDGATYNSENGTVTFTVTHFSEYEITTESAQPSVAQIGTTKYKTLAEAIAAVSTDGTETTITMIADEAVVAGVTVAAGQNIVLELNGKTISGNTDSTSHYALITNRGTLTIQDNTDTNKDGTGTGLITTYITNPDTGDVPSYASNTISNFGNLTVKSGKIVNNGSGYACY